MDIVTIVVHLVAGGAFIFLIAFLLYTQNQLRFVRWCVQAPDGMLRRVDRPLRYLLRFAGAFAIPIEGPLPPQTRQAPRIIAGAALFQLHLQAGILALRFSPAGEKWVCHVRARKIPAHAMELLQQVEKELSFPFTLDDI